MILFVGAVQLKFSPKAKGETLRIVPQYKGAAQIK